jgi:hypothetical protein
VRLAKIEPRLSPSSIKGSLTGGFEESVRPASLQDLGAICEEQGFAGVTFTGGGRYGKEWVMLLSRKRKEGDDDGD